MEYIRNFERYNEDMIVEKLNLQPLLDKLKGAIESKKNNLAKIIIGSLLTVMTVTQTANFIENRLDLDGLNKKILMSWIFGYHDPLSLKLSHDGWEHIRKYEDLKLKAYRVHNNKKDRYGDNKITVGYGHAEPRKLSKYKVGQIISEDEAIKLLFEDVNIAASGIKRMFMQWKEEGIDIKLTQNQYDVLVSMAYNMGIGNFRNSYFVYKLKQRDFAKAAELIKTTGVKKKYRGLIIRRLVEFKKFIS